MADILEKIGFLSYSQRRRIFKKFNSNDHLTDKSCKQSNAEKFNKNMRTNTR